MQANGRPPITDSPWFWVLVFSLAGLVGILAIRPKFERREQVIETKFHARERAYGREAKEEPAPTADEQGPTSGPPFEPIFTLWPIGLVIGAVAVVALVGVLRFHRRHRIQ